VAARKMRAQRNQRARARFNDQTSQIALVALGAYFAAEEAATALWVARLEQMRAEGLHNALVIVPGPQAAQRSQKGRQGARHG
jgi:hypothetical protein